MPAVTPFAFSEEDIRTWCGSSAFARGDALQKAGHVLAPVLAGAEMTAEVLGTWSRMDRPLVRQDGVHLHISCTCMTSTICRHCVAMLLHWTRMPDAFRNPPVDQALAAVAAVQHELTPEEDMSSFLHRYTMADLRALARRRGLTVKGQLKDDYVQRLAALLVRPENIDAAIEGLSDGELMLLTLLDVLRGGPDSNTAGIRNAFHALWGRHHADGGDADRTGLETSFAQLENLGLVIRPTYQGGTCEAPRAVASRVPLPPAVLDLLPDQSAEAGGTTVPQEETVTPIDLVQMLAHQVVTGTVGVQLLSTRGSDYSRPPKGWDTGDVDGGQKVQGRAKNIPASVRLLPKPSVILDGDLTSLAGLTGATIEQIEFVAELMVELEIVQPATAARGAPALDSQRLRSLLTQHPTARRRMLASAWLALPVSSDLRLLRDVLDLRMDANQMHWYAHELPTEKALRLLLARFIGHLATAPPRWYACSNLAQVCATIAPMRLRRTQYALNVWWFTPAGRPDAPLGLDLPNGRRDVYRAIFGALLRGPLRWLGLVDVAEADGELLFRPRPPAAILADREPDAGSEEASSVSLHIESEPDGTPVVSVSLSGDDEIGLLITAVAELLPPSLAGARYRLTGSALQRIFESGVTGAGLIGWMERWSNDGVPESARRRIERAFESFGIVRLYDDLTLMELGDDVLLRELEAVAGLGDMTIHAFSPRLLAVDPEQAPALLASLTKAGYRPRVVEEA